MSNLTTTTIQVNNNNRYTINKSIYSQSKLRVLEEDFGLNRYICNSNYIVYLSLVCKEWARKVIPYIRSLPFYINEKVSDSKRFIKLATQGILNRNTNLPSLESLNLYDNLEDDDQYYPPISFHKVSLIETLENQPFFQWLLSSTPLNSNAVFLNFNRVERKKLPIPLPTPTTTTDLSQYLLPLNKGSGSRITNLSIHSSSLSLYRELELTDLIYLQIVCEGVKQVTDVAQHVKRLIESNPKLESLVFQASPHVELVNILIPAIRDHPSIKTLHLCGLTYSTSDRIDPASNKGILPLLQDPMACRITNLKINNTMININNLFKVLTENETITTLDLVSGHQSRMEHHVLYEFLNRNKSVSRLTLNISFFKSEEKQLLEYATQFTSNFGSNLVVENSTLTSFTYIGNIVEYSNGIFFCPTSLPNLTHLSVNYLLSRSEIFDFIRVSTPKLKSIEYINDSINSDIGLFKTTIIPLINQFNLTVLNFQLFYYDEYGVDYQTEYTDEVDSLLDRLFTAINQNRTIEHLIIGEFRAPPKYILNLISSNHPTIKHLTYHTAEYKIQPLDLLEPISKNNTLESLNLALSLFSNRKEQYYTCITKLLVEILGGSNQTLKRLNLIQDYPVKIQESYAKELRDYIKVSIEKGGDNILSPKSSLIQLALTSELKPIFNRFLTPKLLVSYHTSYIPFFIDWFQED
eukprot:gene2357-2908_t